MLVSWTGGLDMLLRYRVVAALALATGLTSCGDSNPLLGTWTSDSSDPACRNVVVTEKSYRSAQGVQLYTLVEDGDDYILDTTTGDKVLATIRPDKTVDLKFGPHNCTVQRQK